MRPSAGARRSTHGDGAADPAAPAAAIGPLPNGRALAGGLLVALAMLGMYASWASQQRDRNVMFVVAARAVTAGSPLTDADLALSPAVLDAPVARTLVTDAGAAKGKVALHALAPGQLVRTDDLGAAADLAGPDEVAIRLDPDRALGGTLRRGDRVAVLATEQGCTQVVAASATIAALLGDDAGLTQSAGVVTATVRLASPEEVVAVAHAARTADVTLARLSGAVAGPSCEAGGATAEPAADPTDPGPAS